MAITRGHAISAYNPAFARGAKIYGANIQSAVVTSAHIAAGTVVAGDIGAGAVTSAKLGTSAVTNTKILPNAVRAAHISAQAVTSAKLAANQITSAKLRMQVITSSVANSGVVYALTHTLGKTPSIVIFTSRGTVGQLKGVATSANSIGEATVSAKTSSKVYYAGSKNTSFAAYLIV